MCRRQTPRCRVPVTELPTITQCISASGVGGCTREVDRVTLVNSLVRSGTRHRYYVGHCYKKGIDSHTAIIVRYRKCDGKWSTRVVIIGVRRIQRSGVGATVTEVPGIRMGVADIRVAKGAGKTHQVSFIYRLVGTNGDRWREIAYVYHQGIGAHTTIIVRYRKSDGKTAVSCKCVCWCKGVGSRVSVTEVPDIRMRVNAAGIAEAAGEIYHSIFINGLIGSRVHHRGHVGNRRNKGVGIGSSVVVRYRQCYRICPVVGISIC